LWATKFTGRNRGHVYALSTVMNPLTAMANRIRINELSRSRCGSFEVRFPDGRASWYFYWDDIPGRRQRPEAFTREQALAQAVAFARAKRDKV